MGQLKVSVYLFATYREKAGTGRLTIDLAPGDNVAALAKSVTSLFPGLPPANRLVVAVNNEYRDHDFILSDGDEAALIPPVSGG